MVNTNHKLRWFTISTGKPVGLWFVQLVSKTSEMEYAIQDWHIAFVQFTFVQFTESRLTSVIFDYIQVLLFILEIFLPWQNQNSFTIYSPTEISTFFFLKW